METLKYDNLFGGEADVVTDSGTLVSGQNLKRGAVLGKITASGKLAIVDNSKTDGTETAYAILAADTDASSADKTCPLYVAGVFNSNALTFGGDDTAANHKAGLRNGGIYIKDPVKA